MIQLDDVPPLHRPVLIAAFEGWNDAGEAASAAVEHLAVAWDAQVVAAVDPEDYYDFQVNRPRVSIEDGERRITWRTTRVLVATQTSLGRDVILVQGVEPSFRWRAFIGELMNMADAAGVDTVVTLGSLLTDVAHTRPIPITATAQDPLVQDEYGLDESTYEGPTGIIGVIADGATQIGMSALSCWAAVPHYAGHTPSPKATLGLIRRLEELFDASIDHGDLEDEAQAWERGIDEVARADSDIAEYVESLEQAQDATELPEASGDAIAKEFERYLRRRRDDGS